MHYQLLSKHFHQIAQKYVFNNFLLTDLLTQCLQRSMTHEGTGFIFAVILLKQVCGRGHAPGFLKLFSEKCFLYICLSFYIHTSNHYGIKL